MSSLSLEQRALLALSLVSGLGPRLTTALLEHFGTAQDAARASVEQLQQVPHIGAKLATQFRQALDSGDVEAELERMRQHDVHLLFLGESNYPPALASLSVPPRLHYVQRQKGTAFALCAKAKGDGHCAKKLGKGGSDVANIAETIRRNPAGPNPAW